MVSAERPENIKQQSPVANKNGQEVQGLAVFPDG
jgi:hypothetical protein